MAAAVRRSTRSSRSRRAAVTAERVVYRTTHAVPLAHARKLQTYASMHTAEQQKQEQQHKCYWQQQQTGPAAVVAAARSSGGSAAAGVASYERASLLSPI